MTKQHVSATVEGVAASDPSLQPPGGVDPLIEQAAVNEDGTPVNPPEPSGGFEVPDKFVRADGQVDVEALAKSYAHLQQKLSGGDPAPAPAEAAPEGGVEIQPSEGGGDYGPLFAPEKMEEYGRAIAEGGTLTPEQVQAFTDASIPADLVQGAIAYAAQQRQSTDTAVLEVMGGRDEFAKVADWFSRNGSEAELAMYNQAVNSGDTSAAQTAASGILARYQAANGVSPDHRVSGGRQSTPTGVQPYGSWQDAVREMQKPEYKTSPDFRAQVAERISRSGFK